MKFANNMPNGCQDQVMSCKYSNRTSMADFALCSEATNMCRDNVGTSGSSILPLLACTRAIHRVIY